MILFNWKQVLIHSSRKVQKIIEIIDYITFKPIPFDKETNIYTYSQIDWRGDSFLLRPEPLLRLRYGTRDYDLDIAHYIGLASLRNYSEFKTTNKLSLDLLACLGKEDIINKNSLLYIKDDVVHFKYEEATTGDTKWH